LVTLRSEFNAVSPNRDKGADGSIGDTAHTSSSDHTPDEQSSVLRDHDGDSKNEVHALDIDSSGPWPEPGWFDRKIKALVAREKAEYESATTVGRLSYVIWNKRIAARSNGWNWRAYTLDDPHTNHVHFSARYTTAQENDTRPFGIAEWDEMASKADLMAALKDLILDDDEVRAHLAALPWTYAGRGLHGSGTSLEALADSQDILGALGALAAEVASIKAAVTTTPPAK